MRNFKIKNGSLKTDQIPSIHFKNIVWSRPFRKVNLNQNTFETCVWHEQDFTRFKSQFWNEFIQTVWTIAQNIRMFRVNKFHEANKRQILFVAKMWFINSVTFIRAANLLAVVSVFLIYVNWLPPINAIDCDMMPAEQKYAFTSSKLMLSHTQSVCILRSYCTFWHSICSSTLFLKAINKRETDLNEMKKIRRNSHLVALSVNWKSKRARETFHARTLVPIPRKKEKKAEWKSAIE